MMNMRPQNYKVVLQNRMPRGWLALSRVVPMLRIGITLTHIMLLMMLTFLSGPACHRRFATPITESGSMGSKARELVPQISADNRDQRLQELIAVLLLSDLQKGAEAQ